MVPDVSEVPEPVTAREGLIAGAIVGAGAIWATVHLRGTWYFFDEWSMVERVMNLSWWASTTSSFNGHLWMLQDAIYRAQVRWFGLERHLFVGALFVAALALCHATVTSLFRRSGIPLLHSALLGALVTYLGAASQNTLFAVQISATLAMSLCLGATAVALRRDVGRAAVVVATLMACAAILVDSGIAVIGITLFAVTALVGWRSWNRLAVAVPVIEMMIVLLVVDRGPQWPGSVLDRIKFGGRLFLWSAGALVGMGDGAGVVVIVGAVVVVALGWRRGNLSRMSRTLFVAGLAGAFVATAAISQSRAGLVGEDFVTSNRYLQNVALPLLVALATPVSDVVRAAVRGAGGRGRLFSLACAGAIVVAFVSGVPEMRDYRTVFVGWNQDTKGGVFAVISVLANGCNNGQLIDPTTRPLGAVSPQVSTGLIAQLVQSGALPRDGGVDDAKIESAMCGDLAEG